MEISRMSKEEMSVFWEVILLAILSRRKCICTCVLFRTVSEIETFHCTGEQHAMSSDELAKVTDVDGGIFENVLLTDLINALPGNSHVNTVHHATIEEAVFSVDPTKANRLAE
jgi:hypothetical protein